MTIWWGLAGESMQPLWWAVMYNRGNAEVLGYCGGSPRTQLHLTSGLCPLLCQDISPGRQQWLNCQSQMTAAAEIGIKPMISRKSILFWAISPKFGKNYLWDLYTKAHANFWVTNMVFCHSRLPKPSFNLLHKGRKGTEFLNLCFLTVVDLACVLFPLNYIVSFICLLNLCIGCCRIC